MKEERYYPFLSKGCEDIARALLALDNRLAFGVSDLKKKNYGGVKQAVKDAQIQAAKMAEAGILTKPEALFFETSLKMVQGGLERENMDMVRAGLEDDHDYAEELLLEKIVKCECHEGQRGERDGLP